MTWRYFEEWLETSWNIGFYKLLWHPGCTVQSCRAAQLIDLSRRCITSRALGAVRIWNIQIYVYIVYICWHLCLQSLSDFLNICLRFTSWITGGANKKLCTSFIWGLFAYAPMYSLYLASRTRVCVSGNACRYIYYKHIDQVITSSNILQLYVPVILCYFRFLLNCKWSSISDNRRILEALTAQRNLKSPTYSPARPEMGHQNSSRLVL